MHGVRREIFLTGSAVQGVESEVFRLVVFAIDEQRYAIPLDAAERVLRMVAVAPLPQAPAIACGVINLHGRVIPVVDVQRRLGLTPREYGVEDHLLVARTPRRALALPVDEVQGVREVAVAAVTPPSTVLPGIDHVAGIAALPDGLLFIYDLDAFLSLDEERQLSRALDEGAAPCAVQIDSHPRGATRGPPSGEYDDHRGEHA